MSNSSAATRLKVRSKTVGDAKPADVRAWNPLQSEFVADPRNAEAYGRQYAVFRDIYRRTRDLMRRPGGGA